MIWDILWLPVDFLLFLGSLVYLFISLSGKTVRTRVMFLLGSVFLKVLLFIVLRALFYLLFSGDTVVDGYIYYGMFYLSTIFALLLFYRHLRLKAVMVFHVLYFGLFIALSIIVFPSLSI